MRELVEGALDPGQRGLDVDGRLGEQPTGVGESYAAAVQLDQPDSEVALGGPEAPRGAPASDVAPSPQRPQFTAVRLPYRQQKDEADARAAMDFVDADREVTLDIAAGVEGIASAFAEATGEEIADFDKGNVKARARMIAQYALAGEKNLLVIGTDHAAESVTGFFTKFGDGGADILPLYGLNKRQNRELLKVLGAEERLWKKVPTADLLDGKPLRTDEDELGITYDQIDDYLEGKEIPDEAAENLEGKFLRSRHKRTTPVTIFDTWYKA